MAYLNGQKVLFSSNVLIDQFDKGKQAAYDEFWDDYQGKGSVDKSMLFGFAGGGWSVNNFRPKYPMRSKYTSGIFQNSNMNINLVSHCEKYNIILDFSNTTTWSNQFAYSVFTRIGVIDVTGAISNSLAGVFNSMYKLKTIDKLVLKEDGSNTFTNTFNACSVLESISIQGKIGRTISFASSPLNLESAISVIMALMLYKGTTSEYSYSVTFNATTWQLLDADDGIEFEGKQYSWRDYLTEILGWEY